MDAHFKDALAHRLAVTEIAMLSRPDAKDDPVATHFVFQAGEPIVEFLRALKGVHTPHSIRTDTKMQPRRRCSVF